MFIIIILKKRSYNNTSHRHTNKPLEYRKDRNDEKTATIRNDNIFEERLNSSKSFEMIFILNDELSINHLVVLSLKTFHKTVSNGINHVSLFDIIINFEEKTEQKNLSIIPLSSILLSLMMISLYRRKRKDNA